MGQPATYSSAATSGQLVPVQRARPRTGGDPDIPRLGNLKPGQLSCTCRAERDVAASLIPYAIWACEAHRPELEAQLLDQTVLMRELNRIAMVSRFGVGEDSGDVTLDRVAAQHEVVRNLTIGCASGDETEDLGLATSQPSGQGPWNWAVSGLLASSNVA